MKDIQPAAPGFMAEKEGQEKNRRAYLLRKLRAEGVWKLQQEAMTELAKLRPGVTRRHRTFMEKQSE
jgi:hypothetical protein